MSSIVENIRKSEDDDRTAMIQRLRREVPQYTSWTDEDILKAHTVHVSCFQSRKARNGYGFQDKIRRLLDENNIPYLGEVPINDEGLIVEYRKGLTRIDFVIGENIALDRNIRDFIVLSAKTSSRERQKEDDWTKVLPPRRYMYATLTDDYKTTLLKESETRVLATAKPKKRDTRTHKLTLDDIVPTLQDWLRSSS